MSRNAYKVVIGSGDRAGEAFPLTKRITRLGSEAGCDIQIAETAIPAHALSIDTGGEDIVVFNRSDVELQVAGHMIAPSMSAVWKPGKSITLPGHIQLRLESYSPATPVIARPIEAEPIDAPDSNSGGKQSSGKAPSTTAPNKNNTGPYAFIAACLILVVLMIIKKVGSDGRVATSTTSGLTWPQVWTELNSEARLADQRFHGIRHDLQCLYRLLESPNSEQTPRCRSRVLQGLMAASFSQPTDQEFVQQLKSFVNSLH